MSTNEKSDLFNFFDFYTTDLLCIYDKEYQLLRTNNSFAEFFNNDKNQLVGKFLRDLTFPKELKKTISNFEKSRSTLQNIRFKNHLQDANGTTYALFWSLQFDIEHDFYILTGKKLNLTNSNDYKITVSERLHAIVNALTDGFFILSKNWEILYYNDAAAKSINHPEFTALKKQNFWETFSKAMSTKFYSQFKIALEEKIPVSFEEYSPTLKKWFRIDAIPYGEELNVISKDITEQIIEKKINDLEIAIFELNATGNQTLEELMNFLLNGLEELHPEIYSSILKVENNRVYQIASPRLPLEYTNQLNGSLIGPSAGSCGTSAFLKKQIIVEDIATDPLWIDYKAAILPFGFLSCWSIPILSSINQEVMATYVIYYKTKKRPSLSEQKTISKISKIIKILLDDVKANEAILLSNNRYEMVSMATNDAIYDCDLIKNKTYWNDNIRDLFGYSTAEIAKVTNWWEKHLHQDDKVTILNSLSQSIKEKKSVWAAEYRFICKDGSYKYVYDRSFIIYNKQGDPITIIGAMQDINDLKEKEIYVLQQNEKLKEIAQISSHDLRGPVTSILGLINLFNKENVENEENTQVIEYLEYATKQLDEVIHTIVAKTLEADHTVYIKNKNGAR